MPDDTEIRQPQDPTKVNINQPHEVRWWCEKWGITEEELRLVERYGPMAAAIEDGMLDEGFQVPAR